MVPVRRVAVVGAARMWAGVPGAGVSGVGGPEPAAMVSAPRRAGLAAASLAAGTHPKLGVVRAAEPEVAMREGPGAQLGAGRRSTGTRSSKAERLSRSAGKPS